ncbi:alkaline phosphatase family protein [Paraburkholderia sp. FT54]|uniref:alkaline phosphatase family protein n=1 Tax=Paraburkholderia sp. FT54 TaxID=3074437 RepID=UPI0028779F10|nr:alkaline phosphatase family protein [Paraburkholderia sp. FT54]WNC92574.1 alkaline phosphatase family protein [Paraburkholderia sp. FT54]
MSVNRIKRTTPLLTSIAAACVLAACGGNNDITPTSTISGVVASAGFVPGSTTGDPTLKAGYYAGATVCVDANGNGRCDGSEAVATTDATGHFTLTTSGTGQLIADVSTKAINTATGAAAPSHMILRASAAQLADQGATNVVISPMSSEVQRLVEANATTYATEKANLATRLSGPGVAASAATVAAADVLGDVNKLSGAEQSAILFEDNALTNRYTYATTKLDRGDMYPDNLAVIGGDPSLVGNSRLTSQTTVVPTQKQTPITFAQSQQAAFNVEGIPRYDAVFIVMLENRSIGTTTGGTIGIEGSGDAPFIAGNLDFTSGKWNQATTYYSTGNPSEPNYTALGGADDWGITDDNWWGCGVDASALKDVAFSGGKASDGQPLVATPAGAPTNQSALTAFGTCPTGSTAAHNIVQPNLFTQLSNAGLAWRTYSESMNPGQDPRTDSVADPSVVAGYNGIAGTVTAGLTSPALAMPSQLYKTKHHPGMAYQTTRSLPEFYADNRTIFGTQYASALQNTSVYPVPAGYNFDQFDTDLQNGDVGAVNFIMPDQCDDMHGTGNDPTCKGDNLVKRGDAYVQQVVTKIQASPIWNNPKRHVAIVVMFDEGEGSSTSCCGWNPSTTSAAEPLTFTNGKYTPTTTVQYSKGNHGHGNSIFGVVTNHGVQGIQDSDAYSHFALVRTLQDMFQLADPAPGQESTYIARSKYTESFISANILNLPELANSADTHFDSVRPMNHAYITPAGYTQKLNPADIIGTQEANRQPGPDKTQTNIWSIVQ